MLETAITLSEIFFCLQFAVKRKAVGIWGCKDCGKVKAGGAYTMKYFLAYSHYFFRNSPSTVTLGADLVYFLFAALPVQSRSEAQSVA
jgi:hypothetical protein